MAIPAMLALLLCACGALRARAHVALRYPPTKLDNDFLDNARTTGLCGLTPSGADSSSSWQLSEANHTYFTTVQAGQPLNVEWDLHYAHQGGWALELYNSKLEMVYTWDDPSHWGDSCSFDGTVQAAMLTMPAAPCEGCLLRFVRKALEWGTAYEFMSCAMVNVVASTDGAALCNGCSDHGACGADAVCACDSSMELGFFYGDHCERENECEEDAHCGEFGKCIDVGDISGPSKQCFCESGYWGDEAKTRSGTTRRTCTRKSELTLGSPSDWATTYSKSEKSPEGTFQMFYSIDGDEMEVAMIADTTSWVGLGFRAVGTAGSDKPTSGASSASEPAPAPTPASAAEPEPAPAGRRLLQSPSEPEPSPASGEPASTATSEGTASSSCPPLEAGKEPMAATEDLGREITASDRAAKSSSSESESTAEGPASETTTSEPATASEDKPAQVEPSTAATTTSEPAAEPSPSGRRLSERGLPLLESERPALRGYSAHPRLLLQAGPAPAEPEPITSAEPTSEAEPTTKAGGATKEEMFGEGACKKIVNSASAHPMDNQDITMATARSVDGKQYIRVQDMFTPSRAKPQPDAIFGGTDDILDAVGEETSDGKTAVVFRRKLETGDSSAADYCILPGQAYQLVYAYGQLTAKATHVPSSTLEIIGVDRAANPDFYKPDELKYHGGGISIGAFEGRGVLNTVDFFADAVAGCEASTLSGFSCMLSHTPTGATLHYSASATKVDFALESPSTGMVAVAFPDTPGVMIGSTAVIGWVPNSGEPSVQVYKLASKDVSGITIADASDPITASISDLKVEEMGGKTTVSFSRSVGGDFAATGVVPMLAAISTVDELAYHGATRGPLEVNLSPDATSRAESTESATVTTSSKAITASGSAPSALRVASVMAATAVALFLTALV